MKKLLILFLAPLMMFSQEVTLTGDVDCDGAISSEDASLILQFVTNVIDELPCQENMTGLTPEQLQEIINMMDEQLSINYSNGGGNHYPVMISNISSNAMNWPDALTYCADLEELGFNDWFLPNIDQLSYAISGGCELPDERTANGLWTRSPSHTNETQMYRLNESDGGLNDGSWNGNEHCRCLRFEESENSVSGNNASSDSNSLTGESLEQPITMIGPMYLIEDFPEFIHFNTITSGSYIQDIAVSWIDAKRFCSQLEYDGYNDWFLPSLTQIMNYYSQNDFIIISNINNFTSPWTSYYNFWTNSDTGAGAAGQSPYYKAILSIYLPNTTITMNENGDLLDTSNRLLYINSADADGDYRGCFCVR
tara:strand:+ start:2112 stop:3209 length:1098 start_codon:yes stop_codon:yes gene_type:complete